MSAAPHRAGMTSAAYEAALEAELVRQEAEMARELRTELARKDLLAFVMHTYPEYEAGWFHDAVCRKLEWFSREVAAGRSPRLILSAPRRPYGPRHTAFLLLLELARAAKPGGSAPDNQIVPRPTVEGCRPVPVVTTV